MNSTNISKVVANICEITGKRVMSGNKVSKANNKTKRKFFPNLQKKRFFLKEANKWIVLSVSAKAMRTINKKGLSFTLRKAYRAKVLPSRMANFVASL